MAEIESGAEIHSESGLVEPPINLFEGESIISVQKFPIKESTRYPVASKAIQALTGVERSSEIGRNGPSIASRAQEANKDILDLRKYEVLFGRDSLRVALDLIDKYPELTRSTVLELARLQGVSTNPNSEEEPGRIVHEVRDPEIDPIAQEITREKGWEWPYYGSVDSTPMFVLAITQYCKNSSTFLNEIYLDKDGNEQKILNALENSLTWMEKRMSKNHEGFLEFKHSAPGTTLNQAWKDSWDAYSHRDGAIANHEQGIASIEVQALAYDAFIEAAELFKKLAQNQETDQETFLDKAQSLIERAANLKQQVLTKMWIGDETEGYFCLGTDRDEAGNLRQLDVKTSNMGHLLNSHILEGDPDVETKVQQTIKVLFSEEMLNCGGIRTLSKNEQRFRPGSYHNGSVWLWDTYVISKGLERHGYNGLAWNLRERIWNVVNKFSKFPEFIRGDTDPSPHINDRLVWVWDEKNHCKHKLERPPQEIQAWTVSAIVASKVQKGQQLLGNADVPMIAQDPEKRKFENKILLSL